MKMLRGLAASAAAVAFAGVAPAAIVIDIEQVGTDVVATGSGSLDLTGLRDSSNTNLPGSINGLNSTVRVGAGISGIYSGLTGFSSDNRIGQGSTTFFASSGTGNAFGIVAGKGYVYVPFGYVSGSMLSGTSTFNNRTLASMSLTPGSYTYTVPNDTITVNVGLSAAPEPASWALMLGGFGVIGAGLRRRKAAVSVG